MNPTAIKPYRVEDDPTMVPARFSLEGHIHHVRGRHDPERRWNGWACPWIERDEVPRLIDALNLGHSCCGYSEDVPEWELTDTGLARTKLPKDSDYYEEHEPTADGYYAIGAWGWCWQDHKPEEIRHVHPGTDVDSGPLEIRFGGYDNGQTAIALFTQDGELWEVPTVAVSVADDPVCGPVEINLPEGFVILRNDGTYEGLPAALESADIVGRGGAYIAGTGGAFAIHQLLVDPKDYPAL